MKKKILYMVPLMVMALGLASCDPSHDDEGPNASVTSDELTQEVRITAKSEGNNNLTIFTSPTRYIQVYDADTKALVGSGTAVKYQVLPGSAEATIYVVTANQDGTLTTSGTKSIAVNNYTDLDPILTTLFGDGNGGFTKFKYTWDTDAADGVWGNGGYQESTGPSWWIVSANDITTQATDKGLAKDGIDGWFTMQLGGNGVVTSRGETGAVSVTSEKKKDGWDIGTMTFSGTIPLMGILVNNNNQRQYVYQILKATDTELRLCAPEPGAGDWGTAWFWNFKRQKTE